MKIIDQSNIFLKFNSSSIPDSNLGWAWPNSAQACYCFTHPPEAKYLTQIVFLELKEIHMKGIEFGCMPVDAFAIQSSKSLCKVKTSCHDFFKAFNKVETD